MVGAIGGVAWKRLRLVAMNLMNNLTKSLQVSRMYLV